MNLRFTYILSLISLTLLGTHVEAFTCVQISKNSYLYVKNVNGSVACAGINNQCYWFKDKCPGLPLNAVPILKCPKISTNPWCVIGAIALGNKVTCSISNSASLPTTVPIIKTKIKIPPAIKTTSRGPSTKPVTSQWNTAFLTAYISYPAPGSAECIQYNGCKWEGQFSNVDGKWSEEKVKATNIISMFWIKYGGDGPYKLKTILVRDPNSGRNITATVYDTCSDSDCSSPNGGGCCTDNAKKGNGVLIDMERYTAQKFMRKLFDTDLTGFSNKIVEWKCLDC